HAEAVVREGQAHGCAPSQLNPAIMELGALICRPREPDCPCCPIAEFCAARAAGRQNELPQTAPKPQTIALQDACVFIQSTLDGAPRVLLRCRPHDAKIWWRGMWELPRVRVENAAPEATLQRWLRDEMGVDAQIGALLHTMRHGVTQHLITLNCFAAQVVTVTEREELRWFAPHEIDALAVPSTMRQLLRWLERHPRGQEQLQLL
ncbi:MAG: A/G-specific adenine glycosylase, partial [Abditibacteriota bacterium]|nr:A/G-specific adenine glycosylase [Abditibacteriota bacterium]